MSDPKYQSKLKAGLAGRCFIFRTEKGRLKYQGIVHSIIPCTQGDLVLIQYFEALMGEPNTMALVPLADMVERAGEQGYTFFEDDAHLRDYVENVQRHRDRWLDEEAKRERTSENAGG